MNPQARGFFLRRFSRRSLVMTTVLVVVAAFAARPLLVRFELARARTLLAQRDTDAALVHLQRTLWINSKSAEAHFLMARAFRRTGDGKAAQEHLLAAAEHGWPVELLEREQWLMAAQNGDLRTAGPHLEEMLMDPGDDGAEICEAYVNGYFQNYQFERAFPLLEAWQADFPDDEQPYVFQGLFLNHISNFAEAANAYRKALERAPRRIDVRLRLAEQLLKLHEYDEAASEYEACRVERPNDPVTLSGLAECLMRTGRDDEAMQMVRQALQHDPEFIPARLQQGQLELAAGDYEAARDILASLIDEVPGDTEARYAYASALQALGKAEAAREHFDFVEQSRAADAQIIEMQSSLREEGDDLEKRVEIARLLLKFGHHEEGLVWMRGVLDQRPDHRAAIQVLLDYYSEIGDDEEVKRYQQLLEKADATRQ